MKQENLTTQSKNPESYTYAEKFHKLIHKKYNTFSPTHRKIADAYIAQPELLSYTSLAELSQETGFSQSTLLRFCRALGYSGFLQFSKEAHQAIQIQLSAKERFAYTPIKTDKSNYTDYAETNLRQVELKKILDLGIENLSHIDEVINSIEFERVIQEMKNADRIFIIGTLGCYPLALYLFQMLVKVTDNVTLIEQERINIINTINSVNENSLLISIIYPRYSEKTYNLSKQIADKGATVVSITNSAFCPTIEFSKHSLITAIDLVSYADIFITPVTLLAFLAIVYAQQDLDKSHTFLERYDAFADENSLFIE